MPIKTRISASLSVLAMTLGLFSMLPARADDGSPAANIVARGRYLATAADCAACHTAPGGKAMAGGLPIASPFGKIFSSNITPSMAHGIGNYTEAQFARAVREGVDANGARLYPAMPYPSYAGISDDDMKALYAYFMKGVEPVDTDPPPTRLGFPFSQRWLMSGWNLLFVDNHRLQPLDGKSAEWNRGRYLVNTLGHCGACHSPRNVAMAEESGLALSGGQIGPWRAPNITSDPVSGIGGWTHAELVQYLSTGSVAGKGQAAGDMGKAVQESFQYLRPDDLGAIATYLKSVPPIRSSADTQPAYSFGGNAEGYEAGLRATNVGIGYQEPGPGYPSLTTGAQLYSGNCASCHQASAAGTPDGAFPGLIHNSTLGRSDADNLVMVILDGLHIETGKNDQLMPGFRDELTDAQVAQLATFVMKQHGNPAVKVSAAHVALLRSGGENTGASLQRIIVGCGVAVLALLGLLAWKIRRRRV